MTLLQRPSSEQRPDCHSSAGRRLSLGRHKQYLQGLANCAEAWGTPPRRWARWRGAAEGQRAGQRGSPPPAAMGIGRHSEPREFQLTGGAASSLSKRSPAQSGWTLIWQGTGSVCQSGGPPGSERQPSLCNIQCFVCFTNFFWCWYRSIYISSIYISLYR